MKKDMKDLEFWYKHWARAGLPTALFIIVFLFLNSKSEIGSIEWFLWLSIPLYMFHQYEEYVFPGGFLEFMNSKVIAKESDEIALGNKTAFLINIGGIWILIPLFILLSTISHIFSVIIITVIIINGITHIGSYFKFHGYNPGLILSIVYNIPFGVYLTYRMLIEKYVTFIDLLLGFTFGFILHGLLFLMILSLKRKKARIQK